MHPYSTKPRMLEMMNPGPPRDQAGCTKRAATHILDDLGHGPELHRQRIGLPLQQLVAGLGALGPVLHHRQRHPRREHIQALARHFERVAYGNPPSNQQPGQHSVERAATGGRKRRERGQAASRLAVSRKGQSSQFRPEARSQRCRSSAYPPAFRFVPVQPRCRTRTLSRPSALRVASSAVRVPSSVLSDSLTPRR
jgi:hypothetical protein